MCVIKEFANSVYGGALKTPKEPRRSGRVHFERLSRPRERLDGVRDVCDGLCDGADAGVRPRHRPQGGVFMCGIKAEFPRFDERLGGFYFNSSGLSVRKSWPRTSLSSS